MKKTLAFALLLLLIQTSNSWAGMDWFKKKAEEFKDKDIAAIAQETLSDSSVTEGIKEMLKQSVDQAVDLVKEQHSFLNDQGIQIKLPKQLAPLEKALRSAGLGGALDQLTQKMNQSAEATTPKARKILFNSIKDLSIEDVQSIYKGSQTAATDYFKEKTYDQLVKAMGSSMDKNLKRFDVTEKFESLMEKYESLPFMPELQEVNLNDYMVRQTLDGLFQKIAEQEILIRTNPQEMGSQLITNLFGSTDTGK